jgi:alpha-tubulin suppressor-like RCC1 family protein
VLGWLLCNTVQPVAAAGVPAAWGDNTYGQLGDGSYTNRVFPVVTGTMSDITSLSAGAYHSLALRSNGTVWAWGDSRYGQLGTTPSYGVRFPVQVSNLNSITAVSAASVHSLALKSNGTVWAWGNNYNGELGDGTRTQRTTPGLVTGLTGITAISSIGTHNLALKNDGAVWAWGNNSNGQLGDGTFSRRTTPVQLGDMSDVKAIAAGLFHSMLLREDGTVWACGYNESGTLGNGDNTSSNVPVKVSGLSNVIGIAGGFFHSVALRDDGTVWAWGYNSNGQLGDGTTVGSNVPVQVHNLSGIIAVAAGFYHNLALKDDGTVWAWGYNSNGQLGDGSNFNNRLLPVQVVGLTGALAIEAGQMYSVALLDGNETIAPTVTINAPLDNGAVLKALPSAITGTVGDNLGANNVARARWRLRGNIAGEVRYWDATSASWVSASTTLNSTGPTRPDPEQIWTSSGSLPRDETASGGVNNLPEGSYALTAYVNDRNNNQASVVHTFTIDKTPPSATIDAPLTHGAFITALPSVISGTVSDNTGTSNVSQVRWRLSNNIDTPGAVKYWDSATGAWVAASSTLNPASPARPNAGSAWNSIGILPADNSASGGSNTLPGGRYALTVYLSDKADNRFKLTHIFTVDKEAPSISINEPLTHGATISALPATISGLVADDAGVANVSLVRWRLRGTVDGVLKYWSSSSGTWTTLSSTLNATSPTRPSTDATWTSTGSLPQNANLPNGTYSLTAYVNDKAKRASNITHTFTVNSSLAPANEQAVSTPATASTPTTASSVVLSSATASAATQQIRLNFSGALDAEVAENAAHYTLLLNGMKVEVESVRYSAVRHSVVLNLPQSTLRRGDKIVVSWTGLRDVQGREIKGQELTLRAG